MRTGLSRDLIRYVRQIGPPLVAVVVGIIGLSSISRVAGARTGGSSGEISPFVWLIGGLLVLNLGRAIWNVARDVRVSSPARSTTQFDWDDDSESFD
jgi:hypothetical protein